MSEGLANILCIADSSTRLDYIARAIKKLGYDVHITYQAHQAVAVAANPLNRLDAIVMDEDMVLDGVSVAESLKAVSSTPILLVCDKGTEGKPVPAGVDLVTANGSREEIAIGLEKLLARALGAAQS